MRHQTIHIPCDDGTQLAGELLIPDAPKAVVQFNVGTATKRGVYMKFLTYLCEQGYLCCVWDYRGTGKSRTGSLKGSTIRYSDYGTKDMPAVKAWLTQQYPDLPFFIVAHSAGGQQLGFMPNWQGIRGAVLMGVSAGRFKYMPLAYRMQAYFFFYGVVPVSHKLKGYVAASALNLMEDLPSPVALEWRNWLTVDDYFFDKRFSGVSVPHGGYQDFDFPIHNIHASDDSISTPANIANYWRNVKSTQPITFQIARPAELGMPRIDHFGYFKSAMQPHVWNDVSNTLDGWLAAPHTA